MLRPDILDTAKKCVCGDREEDYGSPENSFKLISDLWGDYLGVEITPKDAALMMALLKVARAKAGHKADNYVDLAGYAACAGELDGSPQMEKSEPEEVWEPKVGDKVRILSKGVTSNLDPYKGCTLIIRRLPGDGNICYQLKFNANHDNILAYRSEFDKA